MFEVRRQHPVAAVSRVLEIIRENFITILIIIFVGSGTSSEALVTLSWLVGSIIVLLIWGVADWVRFTYQVKDGELLIKRGIIIRNNLYLTKNRIQVIDITSGVLQRLFGLVSVKIKTAGSGSSEAHINAITREEAETLRRLLREDEAQPTPEADSSEEAEKVAYKLGWKDLFITSSTSGSFGIVLSIVGTVFSQLDQVVSDDAMVDFLESAIPSSTSGNIIFWMIMGVLFFSWVLAFMGTFIKYSGFTLVLKKKEMVISRGLFEKVQLTIPYDRIQAVQISEGLLRQPFGYAKLMLDSAAGFGGENESVQSAVLCPLIKRKQVPEFIQTVIPEYHGEAPAFKPPGVALRRYLVRSLLFSSFLVVPLWFLMPVAWHALLAFVPGMGVGIAQFRAAALGFDDDTLYLRYRVLAKTTAIVKKYRMQSSEIRHTPFQRRLNLVTLSLTVASGRHGRTFLVRELDEQKTFEIWESLSAYPPDREEKDEPQFRLPAFGSTEKKDDKGPK